MKKIYKSLMVLAAAFALPTALFAQTTNPEKYEFNAEKGIGFNKYLVSNTPDADGNYTLRIENFITGKVKQTMTPTDFILVLDVSGSMKWDYRPAGTTVPQYIRKADDEARDAKDPLKLRLDDGQERGDNHYRYTGIVASGNVGQAGSGGYDGEAWAQAGKNPADDAAVTNRFYYYPDDETYYRLYRYAETPTSGSKYYYIYFDRKDANGATIERRYVVQDGNNITTTTTKPTNIHGEKIIIFIDNMNDSGYKLYRVKSRKDALKEGVNTFVDMIKTENLKNEQWEENVTRHQIAVVAFGSKQGISEATLTEPTSADQDGLSKVTKIFREITAENAASYKNWDATCTWQGGTLPYYGTARAKILFERLQALPNMQPLNGAGGTNRAKVMVFFTDGETNQASGVPAGYTPASGYGNVRGAINMTCQDGKAIKETGAGKINGLIYSINLSTNTDYVPNFMKNLSSNNPIGTVNNGITGAGKGTTYDGTVTDNGYYMDANHIDLESVFEHIAKANTGAMTSTLVAVDVMSDSFQIPFTSDDTDKVTMYTAQCIGLKDVEGEEKLAFAQPIKVSERPALAKLWVVRENPTTHEPMWVNLGEENDIDIDNRMAFEIKQDSEGVGKTIIVRGFNYADLWCGEDLAHDNTRQIETDDPNFAYQKDGYRGFKLIFEFPIKLDPDALGGVNVPTNDWASSGLFKAGDDGQPTGNPEVNYPTPDLPVPVKLIIQKSGLQAGESANFTVQRRTRTEGSTWEDFTTFVLTGGVATPEVRIINLDPAYFYKVKEGNWSWAYEAVSPEYSTEDTTLKNPIVFENTPEDDTPKHAEAKATNKMRKTGSTTESTD